MTIDAQKLLGWLRAMESVAKAEAAHCRDQRNYIDAERYDAQELAAKNIRERIEIGEFDVGSPLNYILGREK